MKLLGANTAPRASGQEKLPGQVNYFVGNDPKKWRANVPTYAKVHYRSVYPGIDLVYYGNQQQLEYDFIVKPGGNPRKIALSFGGAQRVRIDKRGELVLKTAGGEVRWHRPFVYQQVNGQRRPIAAKYTLRTPENCIGFQIARYDTAKPLVIDPILAYSTYLGGVSSDYAEDIAVDGAGHIYVAGGTDSADFPSRNAYQGYQGEVGSDIFVTKLDPNQSGAAQLLYSTYIGGSDYDSAGGIALDGAGYVYVAGTTGSNNFPTRNAYQGSLKGPSDAFLIKLDTTRSGAASLIYSTYLGGTDYEEGQDIAVKVADSVYVMGDVGSTDFPTMNAFQPNLRSIQNVFVTRLDTTRSGAASLRYSTYLGGSGSGFERGRGIAVDAAGYVYVTGETGNSNFPIKNAYPNQFHYGVFVTKLDPTQFGQAQLLYSTYLGGYWGSIGLGIAVDGAGNAYVTGFTDASDFPTRNAYQATPGDEAYSDVFVTKLDTTQSGDASLIYSTYLGGSGGEQSTAIAVDEAGCVYVTGGTGSPNFPTWNPCQDRHGVDWVPFVTKLDPTQSGAASLIYSTYLGGVVGLGIAVDRAGNVYVAGGTDSPDLPTVNPYQGNHQGDSDAFVVNLAHDLTDATVSGTISLEDCVNPAQPVTFTFRPADGAPAFSRTLALNADGTFTLPNLARKNYQLAIKGAKWLQKVVSVDASNGDVTNVSALLPAGDANDDNLVDVNDLAAFITAFDTDPSSVNWNNGIADFDCNNIVDVEDLSLLIRNFDASGDP